MEYDVIRKEKSLGTLKATLIKEGNRRTYLTNTEIEYSLMMTFDIKYDYKIVFENGILKESFVKVWVRGNEKDDTYTVLKDGKYHYYKDDELELTINESITYTIEQLFYEEPQYRTRIYSETNGDFHEMKKVGASKYIKVNPNGRENVYFYKGGYMERCDVDAGMIEFSIIRKK